MISMVVSASGFLLSVLALWLTCIAINCLTLGDIVVSFVEQNEAYDIGDLINLYFHKC